jgi:hypothetical protein
MPLFGDQHIPHAFSLSPSAGHATLPIWNGIRIACAPLYEEGLARGAFILGAENHPPLVYKRRRSRECPASFRARGETRVFQGVYDNATPVAALLYQLSGSKPRHGGRAEMPLFATVSVCNSPNFRAERGKTLRLSELAPNPYLHYPWTKNGGIHPATSKDNHDKTYLEDIFSIRCLKGRLQNRVEVL